MFGHSVDRTYQVDVRQTAEGRHITHSKAFRAVSRFYRLANRPVLSLVDGMGRIHSQVGIYYSASRLW